MPAGQGSHQTSLQHHKVKQIECPSSTHDGEQNPRPARIWWRGESLGNAVVQEGGYIARALRHGHNLYGPGRSAIDYEVSANRPEQNQVSGQVLALMA